MKSRWFVGPLEVMCDIEILAPALLIIQVFPAHHSVCHYTDHIHWHVVKLVALTMAWG